MHRHQQSTPVVVASSSAFSSRSLAGISCLNGAVGLSLTLSPSSMSLKFHAATPPFSVGRPTRLPSAARFRAIRCLTVSNGSDSREPLLQVSDLTAVISETKQQILKGVNLVVHRGEVHAIMGKNGSGKSTFSKVLVGHPDYEVTGGCAVFKGENLVEMEPEERSLVGVFMSFQSPIEIPGVNNIDFLNMAYNARRRKLGQPDLGPLEFYGYVYPKLELLNMKTDFLNRNVNEGFSGGEKKRNEILQLAVLGAELAILDEIDSGLDVDAFQDVAKAVNALLTPENSVLMVTHYRRLLEFIKPTFVHIMEDGKIVKTGDSSLAAVIEEEGYTALSAV